MEVVTREFLNKQMTYLLVIDSSQELLEGLDFVAEFAQLHSARLALLYVMEQASGVPGFFMPWSHVGDKVDNAGRVEAQKHLEMMAQRFEEKNIDVCFYIKQGIKVDAIKEVVAEDKSITNVILMSGENSAHPGPLVSYFTRKGLNEIGIPVTVMPFKLEY